MSDVALLTSPAFTLASYIIENAIGVMTDPADEDDWPLYVSSMPDEPDIETNLGVLYNTTGIKDGRLMSGVVIKHYGIQLRIRSNIYTIGFAKAETIMVALDSVFPDTIVIDAVTYRIYNVKRMSSVIALGIEKGTKGRFLFTVNFLVTLKRI